MKSYPLLMVLFCTLFSFTLYSGISNGSAEETFDCCDTGDKPSHIAIQYTGEDCDVSQTTQDADKWSCDGDPNFELEVYIVANDNSDPNSGNIWFSGFVPLGNVYVISAADAGEIELSNVTYIKIFDGMGGNLLQSVEFHTSCSQPITEFDIYGANKIKGILFKNGTTCGDPSDIPPPPVDCCDAGDKVAVISIRYTGEDCSATQTGQSADKVDCVGDPADAASVYIISNNNTDPNSGDIWFSGPVLLDEVYLISAANANKTELNSVTYIHIFDSQGGTLLQFVEFHTSCSQPLFEDDVYGANEIKGILFINGVTCGDPADIPPPPVDCCDAGDKVAVISIRYTGEDCSATQTMQDPDKVDCVGDPDSDPEVYIIANDNVNPASGNIWFSGPVLLNEVYAISAANAGQNELSNATFIHIFDSQGGTLLQFVEFHTSCSQPLSEEDVYGANEFEGILFANGVTCGDPGDIPIPPVDCCDEGDKAAVISIRYTGEDCSATQTMQDPDKVDCVGDPDSDPEVYIIANDNVDPANGNIWFSGPVLLNEVYAISAANAGQNELSNATFIHIFDSQGGTLLQFVEFHTSCSQPLSEEDVYGANKFEGILFANGVTCGDPGDIPPPPVDCCDEGDKVAVISIRYTGEDCSATQTGQSPDKVDCVGDPADAASVYIISNNNTDPNSGDIWFSGPVLLDQVYAISAANANKTELNNVTYIHIFDEQGGNLLQFVEFHTSCSQPLSEDDVYGANEFEGILFANGVTCGIPTPPDGFFEFICEDDQEVIFAAETLIGTGSTHDIDLPVCTDGTITQIYVEVLAKSGSLPATINIEHNGVTKAAIKLDVVGCPEATFGKYYSAIFTSIDINDPVTLSGLAGNMESVAVYAACQMDEDNCNSGAESIPLGDFFTCSKVACVTLSQNATMVDISFPVTDLDGDSQRKGWLVLTFGDASQTIDLTDYIDTEIFNIALTSSFEDLEVCVEYRSCCSSSGSCSIQCGPNKVSPQSFIVGTMVVQYACTDTPPEITCPGDLIIECVDEQICLDFDDFNHGDYVSSITTTIGTVEVNGFNPDNPGPNTARAFYSQSSTAVLGGDPDLGTPNENFGGNGVGVAGASGAYANTSPEGTILIVQNDAITEPNDEPNTGTFIEFDFSSFGPVLVEHITIIDIEGDQNATITMLDAVDVPLNTVIVPHIGNNGVGVVYLGATPGVYKLRIDFGGSGAIDNLCFKKGATYGFPVASSPCGDLDIGFTFSDEIVEGVCTVDGFIKKINRTWTARDENNNETSCTQMITITDNTPPTIIVPEDMTLDCNAEIPPVNLDDVTADDNCDVTVTHMGDVESIDDATCIKTVTRTYKATDECGNMATDDQVFTVKIDTDGPMMTCPPDMLLACNATPPKNNINLVTATDNCTGPITITFEGDVVAQQECTTMVTRTYKAVDECGNMTTCEQVFTIPTDSTPPTITECPADETLACNSEIPDPNPALVTATDNCPADVTITFVEDDLVVVGCNLIVTRTYKATDACGNMDVCFQTITIPQDNVPPTITYCPPSETLECNAQAPAPNPGSVTATDNCPADVTITHDSDTPTLDGCVLTVVRVYKATDACNNMSFCTQVFTIPQDAVPPTITYCPPSETLECNAQAPAPNPGSVTATDNCPADVTITHDSDTPTLDGCVLTVVRVYKATDACDNMSFCTQVFTIPQDNVPPTITYCPPGQTLECNAQAPAPNPASVTATDNCPADVTITHDSDSPTLNDCVLTVVRVYKATDACNNMSFCTQVFTIPQDNVPPTFVECPGDVTLECNADVPAADIGLVSTTDNCPADVTITYMGDSEVSEDCRLIVTRTYKATDACNNMSFCIQKITIPMDDTAPTLIGCPADVSVQCDDDIPIPANVTATDLCADNAAGAVAFDEDIVVDGCRTTITRTWTATDNCNNSTSCTQVIVVEDTTPPTLIGCEEDVNVQCEDDVPPTPVVTATDNCDDVTVYAASSIVLIDCGFIIHRTWTAVDACGNTDYCSQNVRVQDTNAPELECPEDTTIECGDSTLPANTGMGTATDNCDDDPEIAYMDTTVEEDCGYTIIRTWTATDDCGNIGYGGTPQVYVNQMLASIADFSGSEQHVNFDDINNGDNIYSVVGNEYQSQGLLLSGSEELGVGNDSPGNQIPSASVNSDPNVLVNFDENSVAPHGSIMMTFVNPTNRVGFYLAASVLEPIQVTLLRADDSVEHTFTVNPAAGFVSTFAGIERAGAFKKVVLVIPQVVFNGAMTIDDIRFEVPEQCEQRIRVIDTTPPVVINYDYPPVDVTLNCEEDFPPFDIPTADQVFEECGDVTILAISSIALGECEEMVSRSWFVVDECGNGTSFSQTLVKRDVTPPVASNVPVDVTLECDDPLPVDVPSFTDNCELDVTVTFEETSVFNANGDETITRTWTGADECNETTVTQVITIIRCPNIGDTVWNDLNQDGIQDAGEPGVADVTVQLISAGPDGEFHTADDVIVDTEVTDGNGNYLFEEVPPGEYCIQFVESSIPAGFVFTGQDVGVDDAVDSDADATGKTDPFTVVSGQDDDLTFDTGIFDPVNIGDTVWNDLNQDGIQDAGEPGVADVTVQLISAGEDGEFHTADDVIVDTQVTDANGNYLFEEVAPGQYCIQFVESSIPADFIFTEQDAGVDDAVDSDADATGKTEPFTVTVGQDDDLTFDAGIYNPVNIGDTVWNDLNQDGIQDAGEPGVADVTVQLISAGEDGEFHTADDVIVDTQVTDANGNYLFEDVAPGQYCIQFVESSIPADFIFTGQDVGADDAIDSDADATGKTEPFTVTAGQDDDLTFDAGIFDPVNIGDTVWNDLNQDGIQDAGEPGVADVTVQLISAGEDGEFHTADDVIVDTQVTDANGNYLFEEVAPGQYCIQFVESSIPADFIFTGQDAGVDDAVDSDADATGKTEPFTVTVGQDDDLTFDAGIFDPVNIGDTVWNDLNQDGIQDAGEPGVADVTVQLIGPGPDGDFHTADDVIVDTQVTDSDGNYLFEEVAPGQYCIQFVESSIPADFIFTGQDVGVDDAVDSDADATGKTEPFTVTVGQDDDLTFDAGIFDPVNIGDTVWNDLNQDGIQDAGEPGVADVTVQLISAGEDGEFHTADDVIVDTQVTDANGNYLFEEVAPGQYCIQFVESSIPADFIFTEQDAGVDDAVDSDADATGKTEPFTVTAGQDDDLTFDAGIFDPVNIGDTVWNDLNQDGIQDAGEPGVADVTVQLISAGEDGEFHTADDVIVDTQVTDSDGNYLFEEVAPGEYCIQFVESSIPADFIFTGQDVGADDAIDSDADATGKTEPFTVTVGQDDDLTFDAGIFDPVNIGDTVWNDLNQDGIQDAGEPGVADVTVQLISAGEDGEFHTADDVIVDTQVTDSDGNYLFEEVAPGQYCIQFVESSIPADFIFTGQDVGADDAIDSDADATGKTEPFTVTVGQDDDLTFDAGIFDPVNIGDYVWFDDNRNGIQDDDEIGVPDVTVELVSAGDDGVLGTADDVVEDTQVTDANGNYLFEEVAPGDYKITFVEATLPPDYVFTYANQGGDDLVDSDAEGMGMTIPFTVTASQDDDLSWDAGIFNCTDITVIPLDDITVECSDPVPDPIQPIFTDAADDDLTIVYSEETVVIGCNLEIIRTWTATNDCDNSKTTNQSVFILDTTDPVFTYCPDDTTVECETSTDPDVTGTAAATDNCTDDVTVSYADVTSALDCENEYRITRTFTAVDDCENESTCVQIIDVLDTTPPVITCPADVSFECLDGTGPDVTGSATATDACGDVTITWSDATTGDDCVFTVVRTWTAVDACGNATSCDQTIELIDNSVPDLTCPADATIECDESTLPVNTGMGSATDACNDVTVTWQDSNPTPGACPNTYKFFRKWSATDACANTAECIQMVTVVDTKAPEITCPADATLECTDDTNDLSLTGEATATDACNDVTITYADQVEAGDCMGESTITRTWTAVDACGNSTSCPQVINVYDTTDPVFVDCPDDTTIECTESADPANTGGIASATDACTDDVTVSYADVTSALDCANEYRITRTFTAVDDCDNEATCVQIIDVLDTTPPTITCPSDVSFECLDGTGPDITGEATATDACGDVTITWSDATTGDDCIFTVVRTWKAVDACGNATSCDQTIELIDNSAPDLTCPADATIECDESTLPVNTGMGSATDACNDVTVTWQDSSPTPGACPNTYKFFRKWSATDACANTAECTQMITVVDTTPPDITCAPDVTIEWPVGFNLQPVPPGVPQDPSIDPAITGQAEASDNCFVGPPTFSDELVGPIADNCPYPWFVLRTWKATDACGLMATCVQKITFSDFTPPDITCAPDVTLEWPVGFNLEPVPPGVPQDPSIDPAITGQAEASDNCFVGPPTFSDELVGSNPDDCPYPWFVLRTWKATDACGLMATCVQKITFSDFTPPDITCAPDVTLEWPVGFNLEPVPPGVPQDPSIDPAITGQAEASDNCFVGPPTFSDELVGPIADNCPYPWFVLRTWKATDACGLMATCVQKITFSDFTPPDITCAPDVTLEWPVGFNLEPVPPGVPQDPSIDPAITGQAEASDNCFVGPPTFSDELVGPIADNCPYPWFVLRTWKATDACGLMATCVQKITFSDFTPPDITCAPDVTLEWPVGFNLEPVPPGVPQDPSIDPAITGQAEASDNCFVGPPTFSDELVGPIADNCPYPWFVLRTWKATDACGLMATCVQKITFSDFTPPDITCAPDVTLEWPVGFNLQPVPPGVPQDPSIDPAITGQAEASDNCFVGPPTFSDELVGPIADNCPYPWFVLRTWKATDACGLMATCVQKITFSDFTPPDITCAPDVTLEWPVGFNLEPVPPGVPQDPSIDPAITGQAEASDNCFVGPPTFSDELVGPNTDACPYPWFVLRTWKATDACGLMATCVQKITFSDFTPPDITCAPDVTIEWGEEAPLVPPTVEDNCTPVSLIVVTPQDGQLIPTGDPCNAFYFIRTWTAVDVCGNPSSCSQRIDILDTTPPDWTFCPADVTVECETSVEPVVTGTAAASDNCTDDVTVTYSDDETEGDCPNESVIERTWTATDECGNSTSKVQTIEIFDTTPPVITCPADVSLECLDGTGPDVTGEATATDVCGDVTITWSDATTGDDCGFNTIRTWTAVDACGNATSCDQTIMFIDDTNPVITCPEDVTIECDESTLPANTGMGSATDACSDLTVEWVDSNPTPGACPNTYKFFRKWSATDACANTAECIQMITVVDTKVPVITCPADVTIDCEDDSSPANTGMATATDSCDDVVDVTFSDTEEPGECPVIKVITRTWTATDDCGNTAVCTQTISVLDLEGPEISCPADITMNADKFYCEKAIVEVGFPTWTDNCDDDVTISWTRSDGLTLNDPYPVGCTTIEWVASEACSGVSSTCTQKITIVDSQPPTVVCNKFAVALNDDGGLVYVPDSFFYQGVFDNCTDAELLLTTITVERNEFSCSDYPEVLVEVCATDEAGNVGCCNAIVKIQDLFAPEVVCQDITVEMLNGSVEITAADVDGGTTDNADDCDLILEVYPSVFTIPGVQDVTLTATDIGGNVSACSAQVTVMPPTGSSEVQVSAKMWIEGSMNQSNTAMIPYINDLLPLAQPFNFAPFNYEGSEVVDAMPLEAIDWVLVELRDEADPTMVIRTRAGLLMSDGYVKDLDGLTPITFSDLGDGMYFLTIQHRNHLSVISDVAIEILAGQGIHDFTTGGAMGAEPMKLMANGAYALWCGDLNADGVIDAGDRSIAWNMRNQTGYLQADATMDGVVDASERSVTWNNRNKASGLPQ